MILSIDDFLMLYVKQASASHGLGRCCFWSMFSVQVITWPATCGLSQDMEFRDVKLITTKTFEDFQIISNPARQSEAPWTCKRLEFAFESMSRWSAFHLKNLVGIGRLGLSYFLNLRCDPSSCCKWNCTRPVLCETVLIWGKSCGFSFRVPLPR